MVYDSKNLTAVIPSMFCSFNNIILGSIFSTYKKNAGNFCWLVLRSFDTYFSCKVHLLVTQLVPYQTKFTFLELLYFYNFF